MIKKLMIKILNLKLVILLEYQNIKIILQKFTLQIGLKKFFVIKKVKKFCAVTYVISDLNGEEIVGTFYENSCKKQIKENLELKK